MTRGLGSSNVPRATAVDVRPAEVRGARRRLRLQLPAVHGVLHPAAAARFHGRHRRRREPRRPVRLDAGRHAARRAALRLDLRPLPPLRVPAMDLPVLRRAAARLLGAVHGARRTTRRSRGYSSSGSASSTCSSSRCSGASWRTCSTSEQGKRVFAFIAAGASVGAMILAPASRRFFAESLGESTCSWFPPRLLASTILLMRYLLGWSAAEVRRRRAPLKSDRSAAIHLPASGGCFRRRTWAGSPPSSS